MILTATSRVVLFVYSAIVIAAVSLAVLRLSESVAMPGLQAIELVLVALPWSLALGVEPFSRAVVGVVLNGVMLRSIIRLIERHPIRAGE